MLGNSDVSVGYMGESIIIGEINNISYIIGTYLQHFVCPNPLYKYCYFKKNQIIFCSNVWIHL